MNSRKNRKKNLIVSYKNLSDELKELFKEQYPDGYRDYMQRFEKPNGETIFVVPMETEDTAYMIKFDVKIDTTYTDDDLGKDYFDEEVDKADEEFAPLQEAIDKEEENTSHTERVVRHGDYEEDSSPRKAKRSRGTLSDLGNELVEAFSENGEEYVDDYSDEDGKDDGDEESEYEPTDDDLRDIDIDSDFYAEAEIPPEELARMETEKVADPPVKRRGRPRKNPVTAPTAEPSVPKKKGRPRKNPIQ